MELRQLEHFLAVARTGTFTGAAQEVHVVQSALSASVRKLEGELGQPLFERTTRRVLLTEAGKALMPFAQRILAEVGAARSEVAAVAGLTRGQVSVGTIQLLGVVDLSVKLGEFRRRHPGIRIHVRDGAAPGLTAAVGTGELDLAFLAGDGRLPPGMTSFARWEQELVLLSPAGHRFHRRRRVRLAELDDEPFLDFTGSGLQALIARRFADAGVRLNRVCEATHTPLLIDMVVAGLGVTILPRQVADRSDLPFTRLEQPSFARTIHLAGREPVLANPAARALLAQLLA